VELGGVSGELVLSSDAAFLGNSELGKKRGTGDAWDAKLDRGWFKYFAGPVYVNAPGRCVRYGGVVSQPKGRGNLVFYRTFCSRCGLRLTRTSLQTPRERPSR
jgi:hypothetical protein